MRKLFFPFDPFPERTISRLELKNYRENEIGKSYHDVVSNTINIV